MLFTTNYLRERIKPRTDQARDLINVFTQVYMLWVKAQKYGADWTEEQTELNFIQPVLEILKWTYSVQVKVKDVGSVTSPDYTLFRDEMILGLGLLEGEGA